MPTKPKKTAASQPTPPAHPHANNPSQDKFNLANTAKPVEQIPSNQALPVGPLPTQSTDPRPAEQEAANPADELKNAPAVNRKKQKRREKEAAKRAVEQHLESAYSPTDRHARNGHASFPGQGRGPQKGYFTEDADYLSPDFADEAVEVDDAFYSGTEDPSYAQDHLIQNGYQHISQQLDGTGTSKKKKKNKLSGNLHTMAQNHVGDSSTSLAQDSAPPARSHLPPPPPLSNAALRSAHKISRDRIWNTSTQAERENIKQFWLELGEEERRSLVKVEKEAVLRKMKEQQKHSCSCTVCGRKRTAIEEELEVLYDAYYEELEQFANHNNELTNGPPHIAPPRTFNQLRGPSQSMAGSYPSRGRVHEIGEEDDELDDDEDYDEDDEPFSDEEVEELPRPPPDFFTFGNSLTVKGR